MSDNVSGDELKLLIERIERLEENIQDVKDDRKDVYAEVKSRGYDPKTVRAIVALRKIKPEDRQNAEALLETYKQALGLA